MSRAIGRIVLQVACCAASLLGVGTANAEMRELKVAGELDIGAFERALERGQPVRVVSSPGGTGAAAMVLAEIPTVIIDGPCRSACAWAFVASKTACFTDRASFAFHASHDPGTGRLLQAATRYWLGLARPSLAPRLASLLSSSRLIELDADDMESHYADRICDRAGRPKGGTMVAMRQSKSQATDTPPTRSGSLGACAGATTDRRADPLSDDTPTALCRTPSDTLTSSDPTVQPAHRDTAVAPLLPAKSRRPGSPFDARLLPGSDWRWYHTRLDAAPAAAPAI